METSKSQVAEFVLPLSAIPGASMVASAIDEKKNMGVHNQNNTHDRKGNNMRASNAISKENNDRFNSSTNSRNHTYPKDESKARDIEDNVNIDDDIGDDISTKTGVSYTNFNHRDNSMGVFDDDLPVGIEHQSEATPTSSLFSIEEVETLNKKILDALDKFIQGWQDTCFFIFVCYFVYLFVCCFICCCLLPFSFFFSFLSFCLVV